MLCDPGEFLVLVDLVLVWELFQFNLEGMQRDAAL